MAITRPVVGQPTTQNGVFGSTSPLAGLTGAKRDAALFLTNLFKQYGLESLAPVIVDYIKKGYSSDTITILLQDTPQYKQRFAANETRIKKGLPALSPAEYISTETAYRQLMSAAGLPIGFYDSPTDFQKWLENDVSPTEVKSRIDTVSEALNKAPASTVDYFKQFYSTGDIIAYALDSTRAAPLVEQRIKAAEAAATAAQQGVTIGRETAESLGRQGVGLDQLQAGFGFIGAEQQNVNKLNAIYGGEDVTTQDLVQEVFQDSAGAAKKRRGLASQERASFGGGSGQGKSSLSKSDAGSF